MKDDRFFVATIIDYFFLIILMGKNYITFLKYLRGHCMYFTLLFYDSPGDFIYTINTFR